MDKAHGYISSIDQLVRAGDDAYFLSAIYIAHSGNIPSDFISTNKIHTITLPFFHFKSIKSIFSKLPCFCPHHLNPENLNDRACSL